MGVQGCDCLWVVKFRCRFIYLSLYLASHPVSVPAELRSVCRLSPETAANVTYRLGKLIFHTQSRSY